MPPWAESTVNTIGGFLESAIDFLNPANLFGNFPVAPSAGGKDTPATRPPIVPSKGPFGGIIDAVQNLATQRKQQVLAQYVGFGILAVGAACGIWLMVRSKR